MNSELEIFLSNILGLVKGSNIEGIHERYSGFLRTMKEKWGSLMEAVGLFGVPRNTLRDFTGICELRIINDEKYDRVVQAVKEKMGKPSVKVIVSNCREALSDYRAQAIRFKSEEKLLLFYPEDDFYLQT